MRLFVFGLGYSVMHFIEHHAERFTEIAGTVRTAPSGCRQLHESLNVSRWTSSCFGVEIRLPQRSRKMKRGASVTLLNV